MTSLEVLYNSQSARISSVRELVEKVWSSFNLPAPVHFNDIQEEERIAILAAISDWPPSWWNRFAKQIMWIDNEIGRRVCEDLLSGIREIEESRMNDEVQEYTVRDFPISTGEKCE